AASSVARQATAASTAYLGPVSARRARAVPKRQKPGNCMANSPLRQLVKPTKGPRVRVPATGGGPTRSLAFSGFGSGRAPAGPNDLFPRGSIGKRAGQSQSLRLRARIRLICSSSHTLNGKRTGRRVYRGQEDAYHERRAETPE